MEEIDILDKSGNKLGLSLPLEEVHKKGLWHEAIHIIVLNNNKVFLQKRSDRMITFPNVWDISVGGHVSSGEEALTAAKREFFEELGLNPEEYEFDFAKRYQEQLVYNDTAINEYVDLYVVKIDGVINFNISSKEIKEVKWASKSELNQMITNKDIIYHEYDYQILNELLK